MKVILPVGGDGNRIRPIYGPKGFLPVADTTFLGYELDLFQEVLGSPEFYFALEDDHYDCRGTLEPLGYVRRYKERAVTQKILNLFQNEVLDEDTVITSHTDMVYSPQVIREMLKLHEKKGSSVVVVADCDYPTGYYEFIDEEMGFRKIDKLKSCLTVQPLYLLTSEFLRYIFSGDLDKNIVEMMSEARKRGIPLTWYRPDSPVINANYPWEWVEADAYVREIRGIETDTIDPTANVGDSSVVEDSIVMRGARLGREVNIRKSVIGPGVVIGDELKIRDRGLPENIDPLGNGLSIDPGRLGIYVGADCVVEGEQELYPGTIIE